MRGVDSGPVSARRPVDRAALTGSPFFCVELLEDRDIQIAFGQDLFQTHVLKFQRLKAFHDAGFLMTKVLTPCLDDRITDLIRFARFSRCRACGPLHAGTRGASFGAARRDPRQNGAYYGQRQDAALSTVPRSADSSVRPIQTCCGRVVSPLFTLGSELFTLPWSLTYRLDRSSAGGQARTDCVLDGLGTNHPSALAGEGVAPSFRTGAQLAGVDRVSITRPNRSDV